MFNPNGERSSRIFMRILRFTPIALIYQPSINRKIIFRAIVFFTCVNIIGYFRQPLIRKSILQSFESSKQNKAEQVTEMLSKIDIKLSNFTQNYFVILSVQCSLQKQVQLQAKQRILFQINEMVNKKLQINQHYFADIKFLFIGEKGVYDLLPSDKTTIEFYEKQKERGEQTMIYIIAKETDNSQKLVSSLSYKPNLNSILRIITKHKARKFASSMQF